MAQMNYTIEQFKQKVNTPKFGFTIFAKKNEVTGNVEVQYCKDAEGKVVNYTDPTTGEVKPLPKVMVRDAARNIVAFCSAEVSRTKMTGGKALEGAYFEARPTADGGETYLLRKSSVTKYDLDEE